jgi:hypothetical protein
VALNAIAIMGLPATGKTHLAISLANTLIAQGNPCLVLHTDILKIPLRQFHPELQGAGYQGDFSGKARVIRPYLETQIMKAKKDGYIIIIEGTLTLGLTAADLQILLKLPEQERLKRQAQKPISAQITLQKTSLEEYQKALKNTATPATLRLNATDSIPELVTQILANLSAYQ